MRSLTTTARLCSALGSTLPTTISAALLGTGACKLRGFASAKAEPAARELVAADIEFELDRDDPEAADKEHLWDAPRAAALEPVDLDTEFDRDDPEMADKRSLWEAPRAAPLEPVDLDTEFDLDDPEMAELAVGGKNHLWDTPEPPQPANIDGEMDLMEDTEKGAAYPPRAAAGMTEPKPTVPEESPGGTLSGNTPFGQGGRRPREEPDPRLGQFREAKRAA